MEHLWAKYALIPAWEDLMNSGCSSSWSKAFTMDRNQPRLILPKEIEHMIPLILSTIWSTDKLPSYHYYKYLNFNYEPTRITLNEWEQNWFLLKKQWKINSYESLVAREETKREFFFWNWILPVRKKENASWGFL